MNDIPNPLGPFAEDLEWHRTRQADRRSLNAWGLASLVGIALGFPILWLCAKGVLWLLDLAAEVIKWQA